MQAVKQIFDKYYFHPFTCPIQGYSGLCMLSCQMGERGGALNRSPVYQLKCYIYNTQCLIITAELNKY